MSKYLTKEQILAVQDRQYVEVEVKEWGGTVRLASFDADQAMRHSDLMKARSDGKSGVNPLSAMLAASIVDADGKLVFTEADMAALGKKNPTVIVKLVDAAKKLNALDEEKPDGEAAALGKGSGEASGAA